MFYIPELALLSNNIDGTIFVWFSSGLEGNNYVLNIIIICLGVFPIGLSNEATLKFSTLIHLSRFNVRRRKLRYSCKTIKTKKAITQLLLFKCVVYIVCDTELFFARNLC